MMKFLTLMVVLLLMDIMLNITMMIENNKLERLTAERNSEKNRIIIQELMKIQKLMQEDITAKEKELEYWEKYKMQPEEWKYGEMEIKDDR